MRLLLTLLLTFTASAQPSIEGTWLGTLNAGPQKLRLSVTLTRNGMALAGTMNSLDQGSGEMPLRDVMFRDGKLTFALPALGVTYEGTLSGDTITGTFTQGMAFPLTLTRGESQPAAARRPQEPKKPYPYAEEDVVVANGDVRLAGTLTLPRSAPPFPAVVLITGSGAQDRDETVFGHKPFLVLADHLTRRGLAVLRVDDRGTGKSTGSLASVTTEDLAADTLAAVKFLRARKDIAKIGLIGHSEGGVIAPMVANRSQDVAFLVLVAAPGLPGDQIIMRQTESLGVAAGASREIVAQGVAQQRQILDLVMKTKDEAALRAKLQELLGKQMTAEMLDAQVRQLASPWYRWMLAYDPRPALRKVRVPLLAINGAKDIQVAAKENLAAIAAAAPHAKIVELPGLNHLLQTAATGAVSEYATIEETVAPVALEMIAEWISRVTTSQSSAPARPD
ncbi:MAG TPA: alpha/beta hydrolase [Thermoanaerobaculia bacterium]